MGVRLGVGASPYRTNRHQRRALPDARHLRRVDRERTGIRERRIGGSAVSRSSRAKRIEDAGLLVGDIDFL